MANAQTIVLDGSSLTIETLVAAARNPQVRVECAAAAIQRVERCEAKLREFAAAYESRRAELDAAGATDDERTKALSRFRVYGVTTGFGEFKNKDIDSNQLLKLQENILISHSSGVGDNSNPDDFSNYFPADVVRGALLIRLNTFLKGHSGIRLKVVECVRAMLNEGVIPLVPTRGSLGSSGDLCPLCHLFATLLGRGRYYLLSSLEGGGSPGVSLIDRVPGTGDLRPAGDMPDACRLATDGGDSPLSYKEGLALSNGAAFSAAMLALAVDRSRNLAKVADISTAMSVEAMKGRSRAFDPKPHECRGMAGQIDSAAGILRMLGRDGSVSPGEFVDQTEEVQDPYSLRCAPQVHGASRDAVAYAAMVVSNELNAATDNPLFFPDDGEPCDHDPARSDRDWHAYSAGNFHGQPLALAADFLAIALAEFANISERRVQLLLDSHHNRGLPGNLIAEAGLNSGYMIAQYCAASLVSENKVLAHPASVDSIPTSSNSEDHNAMATHAARKLRTVLGNAESVLAIELMVAASALEWRHAVASLPEGGWKSPGAFQRHVESQGDKIAASFGPGASRAYLHLRGRGDGNSGIAPLFKDEQLDLRINQARRMIETGSLARAVGGLVRPVRPLAFQSI